MIAVVFQHELVRKLLSSLKYEVYQFHCNELLTKITKNRDSTTKKDQQRHQTRARSNVLAFFHSSNFVCQLCTSTPHKYEKP